MKHLPRGKHVGTVAPKTDAPMHDHLMKCPECGAWFAAISALRTRTMGPCHIRQRISGNENAQNACRRLPDVSERSVGVRRASRPGVGVMASAASASAAAPECHATSATRRAGSMIHPMDGFSGPTDV
jgi:hypothetical protein